MIRPAVGWWTVMGAAMAWAGAAQAFDDATKEPQGSADVVRGELYRCRGSDGAVAYVNNVSSAQSGTCKHLSDTFVPNPKRPGLHDYRVLQTWPELALLVGTQEFRVDGDRRTAWVMTSYAQTQAFGIGSRLYTREVARYTVDCQHDTLKIGTVSLYRANASDVVPVGFGNSPWKGRSNSDSKAAAVAANLCGLDVSEFVSGTGAKEKT